ncbi:MAG: helix-turn-helix domain-containing protein [Litorimonas sp.]
MFAEYISTSGKNRSAWAEALGISRSYLSEILNGNRRPSLELAVSIERKTCGAVSAVSWIEGPAEAECEVRS